MLNRLSAILVVFCFTAYFTLVVFNNVTDYSTNEELVKSVLSMKEIKVQAVHWRAVTSPTFASLSYIAIIIAEFIIAVLCWVGLLMMTFGRGGKEIAEFALIVAFCFYMIVFLVLGTEWFYLWQDPFLYNLPIKVVSLSILLLIAKLYLSSADNEK